MSITTTSESILQNFNWVDDYYCYNLDRNKSKFLNQVLELSGIKIKSISELRVVSKSERTLDLSKDTISISKCHRRYRCGHSPKMIDFLKSLNLPKNYTEKYSKPNNNNDETHWEIPPHIQFKVSFKDGRKYILNIRKPLSLRATDFNFSCGKDNWIGKATHSSQENGIVISWVSDKRVNKNNSMHLFLKFYNLDNTNGPALIEISNNTPIRFFPYTYYFLNGIHSKKIGESIYGNFLQAFLPNLQEKKMARYVKDNLIDKETDDIDFKKVIESIDNSDIEDTTIKEIPEYNILDDCFTKVDKLRKYNSFLKSYLLESIIDSTESFYNKFKKDEELPIRSLRSFDLYYTDNILTLLGKVEKKVKNKQSNISDKIETNKTLLKRVIGNVRCSKMGYFCTKNNVFCDKCNGVVEGEEEFKVNDIRDKIKELKKRKKDYKKDVFSKILNPTLTNYLEKISDFEIITDDIDLEVENEILKTIIETEKNL